MLDGDFSAHRLQALDVLVDRPESDRTTTRERDASLAAARRQRPEHQNGCAHGAHELVRRDRRRDVRRGELDPQSLVNGDRDAQLSE